MGCDYCTTKLRYTLVESNMGNGYAEHRPNPHVHSPTQLPVVLIVHLTSRHTQTLSLSHTHTLTHTHPSTITIPLFEDHNDNNNCRHHHSSPISRTFFFKSEKSPPNQPPKDCSNRLLHPQPSLVIYPPRTHAFHFHFKFHLNYQSRRGERRIRSRDGAITPLCCSVRIAWLARLGHPHRFASHHRPTGLVEDAC